MTKSEILKKMSKQYAHLNSLYFRVTTAEIQKASAELQETIDSYGRLKNKLK